MQKNPLLINISIALTLLLYGDTLFAKKVGSIKYATKIKRSINAIPVEPIVVKEIVIPNLRTDFDTTARLSSSSSVAYAYMKGGDELVKIAFSDALEKDDNVEIIRISNEGFYPNFLMNSEVESGSKCPGCLVKMSDSDKDKTFCKSYYTTRKAFMTGFAVIWNAAATFTTVGLNVATGAIADPKFFIKDEFLQIATKAELPKYKAAIEDLIKFARVQENDVNGLYDEALNKYKENKENITLKYKVSDKSGLLISNDLNSQYRIEYNVPKPIIHSYQKFYSNLELTPANYKEQINTAMLNIANQVKKDLPVYKTYVVDNFKTYKVVGTSEQNIKYNNNISFHANINAPTEIPYKRNEKMDVNVAVTVDYANLTSMIPKTFSLNDINLKIDFIPVSDRSVSVVVANKTESFITLNSLTNYFKDKIFNISNVNREMAPQASTTADDSSYALLPTDIKSLGNFDKVTKASASSTSINYGYAIKYRVNDTNIDKSMYITKKYTLLDVFSQYK